MNDKINEIVIALLISLALLIGCQWYQKLNGHKGLEVMLIGAIIIVIDYLIMKHISSHSQIGMLKFMWVKVALVLLIPVILLTGKKLGKNACVPVALIGCGLIMLLFQIHQIPHYEEPKM